jgi:myo-inositol-1(or 4)-monophosphatase
MGTQLTNDIARIERSLKKTSTLAKTLSPEGMNITWKANHDPVTEADLALNELLHAELVRQDYGWLSEETADDKSRLVKRKVWVVDPIDGTREFISGIPEWVVRTGR